MVNVFIWDYIINMQSLLIHLSEIFSMHYYLILYLYKLSKAPQMQIFHENM